MTTFLTRWRACCGVAAFILVLCMPAFAGPGAHGPGGQHLDAAGKPAAETAQPRIETKSEVFELVGYLSGSEFSVMINRFETNEPVLDARVEVSVGSSKTAAKFHADHGDYAVDDAAFLKLLSAPGEHALIFTVVAGNETDLLEGALTVSPEQVEGASTRHSHFLRYTLIVAAALVVLAVAFALRRRRLRNRMTYASTGGLS